MRMCVYVTICLNICVGMCVCVDMCVCMCMYVYLFIFSCSCNLITMCRYIRMRFSPISQNGQIFQSASILDSSFSKIWNHVRALNNILNAQMIFSDVLLLFQFRDLILFYSNGILSHLAKRLNSSCVCVRVCVCLYMLVYVCVCVYVYIRVGVCVSFSTFCCFFNLGTMFRYIRIRFSCISQSGQTFQSTSILLSTFSKFENITVL